jgi:hypothetical protein
MTSFVRRCFATAAAALGFALAPCASATTFSVDHTDLWETAGEAGWGINLIQQGNNIFASMFVYGPDSSPRWYFASGMTGTTTSYSGTLFRTTGPVFSAAFIPTNVVVVPVGSMTVTFSDVNAATLSYTIDGTSVTKQLRRNSAASNNLAGNYLGGLTALTTGCANSANNGAALIVGELVISQVGSTVSMQVQNNFSTTDTCSFTGSFTPQGRLGTVTGGTWSCTRGNSGTFTMTQVDAGIDSMGSVFSGKDQFCNYSGRFGGLKDVL